MASIMVECGAAELRLRGDLFPLLHGGATIPHAAGIRQPARADCAVDGDSLGSAVLGLSGDIQCGTRPWAHHRPWCDRHDEHGRGDGPAAAQTLLDFFFNDTATKPRGLRPHLHRRPLGAVGTKIIIRTARKRDRSAQPRGLRADSIWPRGTGRTRVAPAADAQPVYYAGIF